jgi:hypothetical protein
VGHWHRFEELNAPGLTSESIAELYRQGRSFEAFTAWNSGSASLIGFVHRTLAIPLEWTSHLRSSGPCKVLAYGEGWSPDVQQQFALLHRVQDLAPGFKVHFLFGDASATAFDTVAPGIGLPMPYVFLIKEDFSAWASFAGRHPRAQVFVAGRTGKLDGRSLTDLEKEECIREFHAAFAEGLYDEVLKRFIETHSQIHHPPGAQE